MPPLAHERAQEGVGLSGFPRLDEEDHPVQAAGKVFGGDGRRMRERTLSHSSRPEEQTGRPDPIRHPRSCSQSRRGSACGTGGIPLGEQPGSLPLKFFGGGVDAIEMLVLAEDVAFHPEKNAQWDDGQHQNDPVLPALQ